MNAQPKTDNIEEVFFSGFSLKKCAQIVGVDFRVLRAMWIERYGSDAYEKRKLSVRAKSAALSGLVQRRPSDGTKVCSQCRESKALSRFVRNGKRHDGRSSWCLECSRKYQASRSSRYKYHDKARQRRQEFRDWLDTFKTKPCADCQREFPPVGMDFDHVRGVKVSNVSAMTNWRREQVLIELAKCDVVCAVCHRIRTQQRRRS